MKEIFNIKRFGALWIKTHRENRKSNLIWIGIMLIVTFMCMCHFNPFVAEYTKTVGEAAKENFFRHYREMYTLIFWGLLFLFSIVMAVRSFKDILSPHKATGALLLPASVFEKYLLAFVNATLVVFVVYLVLFYGMGWIVNSYKYAGVSEFSFTDGWLGVKIPQAVEGQEIIRPVIGNVLDLTGNAKISGQWGSEVLSPFLSWSMLLISWIFLVSVFMWGSVTFRKRTALLTILVHFFIFLAVGYGMFRIIKGISGIYFANQEISSSLYPDLLPPSPYWGLLSGIFPLTYLVVVWLKLRKRQVN